MISRLPRQQGCPHLGLADDNQTFLAYPSDWNLCYHCRPPKAATFDHQSQFCLTAAYSNCSVYTAAAGMAMPAALRNRARHPGKGKRRMVLVSIYLLVFALLIAAGIWFSQRSDFARGLAGTAAIETAVFLQMQPAVSVHTDTPEKSTETAAPASTDTADSPTQTPGPVRQLGLTIGREERFVLHRIAGGENIALLARQYNTSDAAIVAVNFVLPVPIWVDWVVVIPIDRTAVSHLPTFEPIQAVADQPANELALDLGVDVLQFLYYNGLEADEVIRAGEWVLVPRGPREP